MTKLGACDTPLFFTPSNMTDTNLNDKTDIQAFSFANGKVDIPNEVVDVEFISVSDKDYVPFGSDNLFPQAWEGYLRHSSTARSVIKWKTIYTMGKGINPDDLNPVATGYIDAVNNKNECFEDILSAAYKSDIGRGNIFIEMARNDGFVSMWNRSWTICRYSSDGKFVIVHPDWRNYELTKDKAVKIPLYPNFGPPETIDGNFIIDANGEEMIGERSMLHIKRKEDEFDWYGLPDGVASKDAIAIGYTTTSWNRSRVENGMQVSGMLVLSGKYSNADAKKVKQQTEEAFTGEDNQGKIMCIVKSLDGGKEASSEFIPVGSQSDADWTKLHEQSDTEIVIAMNWFRSLSSLPSLSTGFDTERIINDYHVAESGVISDEQRFVLKKILRALKFAGTDLGDLKHINKPPIPVYRLVKNFDAAVKIWEVRQSAGLSFDEDDEKQQKYLAEGKAVTEKAADDEPKKEAK